MANQNQRKRIWIDRFQTLFMLRMLFYCVAYQASLWIILYIVRACMEGMEALTDKPPMSQLGIPAIFTVLALLGIMTVDAVRYMHRLVGPLYRFRRTVQTVAAGEPVDLVRLRRDDFLKDFAADFNEMLKFLEEKGAITVVDKQAVEQVVAAR